MKLALLLLCSCNALPADNAALIRPQRVQLDYPDDTRVIVEVNKFDNVASVSLTIGKKKLVVDAANLVNIENPDLSKIDFQRTYDERLKSKIWIVSFEYRLRLRSWGYASNNVEFVFSETEYSGRTIKLQTSKDTCEYLTKPAKGAETKEGIGGSSGTGDADPESKGKSDKTPGKNQ